MENTFLTALKLYYHYNCQLTLFLINIFMIHLSRHHHFHPHNEIAISCYTIK